MPPPPTSPKRKDPPAEPFKRALGMASRAIAGDKEMQVAFGAGKPEVDGHSMTSAGALAAADRARNRCDPRLGR